MKKFIFVLSILFIGCNSYNDNSSYIKVKTDYGHIVIRLYNETPNHRDNFKKLAEEKFFDGTIFHRVIKEFMIQGGDPDTKNAIKGKLYGESDAGYLINSEFVDTIIHKKGAVAMAREGDDINPEKKSSSSQFYIVVGKIFTNEDLDKIEKKINNQRINEFQKILFEELLKKENNIDNQDVLIKLNSVVKEKTDSILLHSPKFQFSKKQREIYTTIGGTPHLDGNYTVFGEVIEGMDVVDKISKVKTDENDRPINDIKVKISVLN